MRTWRYDPADYVVGDTIWLQFPNGWNTYNVRGYKVAKKTPSGQILAKNGDKEIRFTKRGDVVGAGAYSKESVCSPERASELRIEAKERAQWQVINLAAADLEKYSRKQDEDNFAVALSVFNHALKAKESAR